MKFSKKDVRETGNENCDILKVGESPGPVSIEHACGLGKRRRQGIAKGNRCNFPAKPVYEDRLARAVMGNFRRGFGLGVN